MTQRYMGAFEFERGFHKGYISGLEMGAKIAEKIKFSRICQEHGHSDGDIKWTFYGCDEIAQAIRTASKELKG